VITTESQGLEKKHRGVQLISRAIQGGLPEEGFLELDLDKSIRW
jgi:hypothetical protein